MKKMFWMAAALVALVSCNGSKNEERVYTIEEDKAYLDSCFAYWRTCAEEISDSTVNATLEMIYNRHKHDSLGLAMFGQLAYDWDAAKFEEMMADADSMILNNSRIANIAAAKRAEANTTTGCAYIDIVGVDAQTGNELKLSDILAQGKPVIVDFWASWCRPCRHEISEYMSKYAPQYKDKVNFVGIAVWERDIEDTQKAMKELPISWPVIFAGGRGEDSPATAYGVLGIPHLMLIGSDGTILARNLRGEGIMEAIEAL